MKTPDEIRNGLGFCAEHYSNVCLECPYNGYGYGSSNCSMCISRMIKDALAYIQQLEAQQPRWISVKEREPEYYGLYYCHTAIWGDIMCRYANGRWVDDKARFTNFPRRPTHWLEILYIPQPPKEET